MKGRKHKGTGGVNEAEADEKDTPKDRTEPSGPAKEAEEKKHGGRAKRKHGGMAVEGKKHGGHAGRMPRKSGGRAGSETSPLTSSHSGKQPPGRSVMSESMD
jgi:hypothetical protein